MGGTLHEPAVSIVARRRDGALYTGVTFKLAGRVYEHREARLPGCASRYACKLPVRYAGCATMTAAITRETQIKAPSRKGKLASIEAMNPDRPALEPDLA